MTPERFREIRNLFEAALERLPAEREKFVTAESGGDLELRTEVLHMLRAEAKTGGPIDYPALAASAPPIVIGETSRGGSLMDSHDLEGRRIGPYLLQRRIGCGGMGTVYLATRDDEAFKKRVAVKFVQPRLGGPDLLRHFQQERQILAALDHPNIARLLDGGTTSDGIPYLVMEYVEGKPIDEYCNDRKLNVTERLKLFREVCAAVQYAHQNLIVHRDLKPSNILVAENGTVKLLDFGIAKLLHADGLETPTLTCTGIRLMTPEYASPEQVKGEAITTATDIYSLGVVLYELLTGHRPYRLKSRLLHEVVRIICEEEPTRPSTVISVVEEVDTEGEKLDMITPDRVSEVREGKPGRLKKRLTGDLDTILLMSLRKEPKKRYSSVEQFSEDLQRHLSGWPLIARRGAFPYRIRKFIHRNRKSLTAAALVVSIAILYFITEQRRRSHQESLTAQDLFYSMKFLDLDIANLEKIAIRSDMQRFQPRESPEFSKHVMKLRERRREVQKSYDRLVDALGVYPSYSEQERVVLRVTRIFGECELTVPPAFIRDVQKHIKLWQSSRRFESAIQNARKKGYLKKIVEELSGQNLPPQFLYIALQESDFREQLSGPPTQKGIAKGMWQFTPDNAVKYGLRLGPLADSRRPDPADERLQWDKATRAAALYLKDLYINETQASALLTIAYFNWGETRLRPLLRSLDENPRERNFWRLFSLHKTQFLGRVTTMCCTLSQRQ